VLFLVPRLPSFGRVWNAGPRSHTQSEFRREMVTHGSSHRSSSPNTNSPISTVTVTEHSAITNIAPSLEAKTVEKSDSCQSEVANTTVKPYVRRRVMKSNTVQTPGSDHNGSHDSGMIAKPYVRKRKLCETD